MKENSFKRNRKVLTALLLCTGFIAAQPLAVMAEDSVTSVHAVQQQKQTVTGIIKDATGEAIIGASVLEKGTSNGTITDLDGKFTLSVTPNATLVISYIGYQTQELPVVAGKVMDIQMKEDAEMLDEVVVVGYGTQKKINVTGAIAQVDNKELKMAPSGNLSSMLAGRLPGLITKQSSGQPGKDGASLYIRGNGAGDGDPLIVIDGVVTDYFPTFSPARWYYQ